MNDINPFKKADSLKKVEKTKDNSKFLEELDETMNEALLGLHIKFYPVTTSNIL